MKNVAVSFVENNHYFPRVSAGRATIGISNITNVTPPNIMNNLLTPSPSPEEYIIQARGRKKGPIIYSPNIDESKKVIIIDLFM